MNIVEGSQYKSVSIYRSKLCTEHPHKRTKMMTKVKGNRKIYEQERSLLACQNQFS